MTSDAKRNFATRFLIFTLAAATAFSSCTRKKRISGDDYIPRDQLVEVLIDIHLVDGITNDVKYYHQFKPTDSIDLYGAIFDKYQTNREEFEHTIDAYSRYPDLLDAVYDDVIMQLNMMKDSLGLEPKLPDRKKSPQDTTQMRRPAKNRELPPPTINEKRKEQGK